MPVKLNSNINFLTKRNFPQSAESLQQQVIQVSCNVDGLKNL